MAVLISLVKLFVRRYAAHIEKPSLLLSPFFGVNPLSKAGNRRDIAIPAVFRSPLFPFQILIMAACSASLHTFCCSSNVYRSLFPKDRGCTYEFPLSVSFHSKSSPQILAKALSRGDKNSSVSSKKEQKVEDEEEEVEEDLPWIQEKALDLVEFTGSVSQAIPGPRVGRSSLPWVLAIPLAYLGVTFVLAFVKTVRKFNSPREKRRKLVNNNAMLCKSIDELFEKGTNEVTETTLKDLVQKTGFSMEEILRKYIRYALNEKPFNAELVSNLIHLRKNSMLEDSIVAEILNEISSRIVKDKGPVVMDMSGYSEKGFKRKLAVQALFGKVYYMSELPEFCSRDSSLTVKEIFGVADEDAEKLRLHTYSEAGDIDSLEKLMDDGSDTEGSTDESGTTS